MFSSPRKPLVLMLTTDREIDRRTLQQADTLEVAGWNVVILAMPLDKGVQEYDGRVVHIDMEPTRIGLKNCLLLFFYKKIRYCLPMNSGLMRFLKKLTWKYVVDQETFYLSLFSKKIFQYSPDVVVAIDLPTLPVAIKISHFSGAKLVYDSHELYSEQEFSEREKQVWRNIEAKYIQYCDSIITVNPSIACELKKRYGVQNVNVIYNAMIRFHPSSKIKIYHNIFMLSPERKILLFQGGLSKNRNLETLVISISYIKNPFVDLVILGNGQLRIKLDRLVSAHGIKNRVYFCHAVSQKQLLDYTQAADAGIIPYLANCLNNYYCTPNKLFEYITAGLPVLSNDLPEVRKILDTHTIGLTGSMNNPKDLAALIDNFFSNEDRLFHWKKNVTTAREEFCWSHEEKKLLRIFKGL